MSSEEKGLFALLNEEQENQISRLELDSISTNPDQDRGNWDDDETIAHIEALAETIYEKGDVNEPIYVRPHGENGYILIDGECRYRAAKLKGLTHLSAIIKNNYSHDEASKQALQSQVNKLALTPLALAKALQARIDSGWSVDDLKKATGKSNSWISRRLSLLKLPDDVVKLAKDSIITDPETLIKLSKLPDDERVGAIASLTDGTANVSDVLPEKEKKPKAKVTKTEKEVRLVISVDEAKQILLKITPSLMLQSEKETVKQWGELIEALDEG